MLKVEVDAVFLHQPLDKLVVGFSVLRLVIQAWIAATTAVVYWIGVVAQDFFDDLKRTFLLVDFIVAAFSQYDVC